MQAHEGDDAAVQGAGGYFPRGDAAQVEQREAEGRGQEGGLQVSGDQHAQPNRVHAQGEQRRPHHRNDHEGDFDEVQHEAEQEDRRHHRRHRRELPAGKVREQPMHQVVAAKAAEHQGEHRSADEDEEHHRRGLQGGAADFANHLPVQGAVGQGQQDGAQRADAGRLRGGGQAGQNAAQHRQHQTQGRGQGLQQPPVGARLAAGQASAWAGRPAGRKQGGQPHVESVKPHQHQAGNQRPGEQVADGDGLGRKHALRQLRLAVGVGEHVAEQHQGDGRRNDLPQGAGGADGAGGELRVIALPQQVGQRHQAQGHHRGADDAGARRHQPAHQDDAKAKAAGQPRQQFGEGVQQLLGDAGLLQHHAHEHEQGHGDERLVAHDAEDARRQKAEHLQVEQAEGGQGQGEGQGAAGQRQRHRIAKQQQREHQDEQRDGGEGGHHRDHLHRPPPRGCHKRTAAGAQGNPPAWRILPTLRRSRPSGRIPIVTHNRRPNCRLAGLDAQGRTAKGWRCPPS